VFEEHLLLLKRESMRLYYGRFKLEVVHTIAKDTGTKQTRTTLIGWYNTREKLDASVKFMEGLPQPEGTVSFRITESQ
jgi:hypothetical protein